MPRSSRRLPGPFFCAAILRSAKAKIVWGSGIKEIAISLNGFEQLAEVFFFRSQEVIGAHRGTPFSKAIR